MKPFFITLEGIDGSGKTTLIGKLHRYIQDVLEEDVVLIKEPGCSLGGDTIRQMLFQGKPGTANMLVGQADCLLLYDHIGTSMGIVKPSLEAGKWVLCDRYADSQFAYAASKPTSKYMNEAFAKHFGPVPDITFLLIGDVHEMNLRAKSRDLNPGAAEPGKQQGKVWGGVEDQSRIQDAYLVNLSNQPRTIILNIAGKSEFEVGEMAIEKLNERIYAPPPATNVPLFANL